MKTLAQEVLNLCEKKEWHQMTRKEFLLDHINSPTGFNSKWSGVSISGYELVSGVSEKEVLKKLDSWYKKHPKVNHHKDAISIALQNGAKISNKILKDYPDLGK